MDADLRVVSSRFSPHRWSMCVQLVMMKPSAQGTLYMLTSLSYKLTGVSTANNCCMDAKLGKRAQASRSTCEKTLRIPQCMPMEKYMSSWMPLAKSRRFIFLIRNALSSQYTPSLCPPSPSLPAQSTAGWLMLVITLSTKCSIREKKLPESASSVSINLSAVLSLRCQNRHLISQNMES